MSTDLTKLNVSNYLAKQEKLYLLNVKNGRVLDWTAYLSVAKGFIDCTSDGQPINPADVPGNHPWIKEQTKGLDSRVSAAGGDADTLYQIGQQLTQDGNKKFKALEYEKSKTYKLEDSKSAAQAGATIRIYNKIDRMCERAKKEIRMMALDARIKLGLPW